MSNHFLEIEHKFLLPSATVAETLRKKIQALQPSSTYIVSVEDTYFYLTSLPHLIFRHRADEKLQQLTVKSLSLDDNESRREVNLDLSLAIQQHGSVAAFLHLLGGEKPWQGSLQKEVEVFEFPHCEIVIYRATGPQNRAVECLELEATHYQNPAAALATIEKYEKELQLNPQTRARQSLFEMLLLPYLPAEYRRICHEYQGKDHN